MGFFAVLKESVSFFFFSFSDVVDVLMIWVWFMFICLVTTMHMMWFSPPSFSSSSLASLWEWFSDGVCLPFPFLLLLSLLHIFLANLLKFFSRLRSFALLRLRWSSRSLFTFIFHDCYLSIYPSRNLLVLSLSPL